MPARYPGSLGFTSARVLKTQAVRTAATVANPCSMQIEPTRVASGDLLERLLALTHAILQADDTDTPLEAIAHTISELFGFRYVSIVAADDPGADLYRRVLLGFDEDVIASRLGERIARDDIKTILLPEFEVLPNCFYCPAERELFWARSIYVGDSGLPERATPNTWHERDSLTMVLPDRDGRMLGYMSVDGPIDGKVPSIETLRQMQLFLNMVGLALANSRAHRTEVERRKLLEENARLQNEFFSMVSHEVRSPLAAIGGATSLLETHFETMGDDRRGELLGVLSSSTARLASIFEDFLLLSRMEAGSLGLRIESIAPIAVTEEAIARLRSEHPTRVFNLAYLDPIPPMLGDEGRTVQVLVNLLSNAVKYSYPGTPIHVEIKPGATNVTISVVNEGDGVPQAERGMLFPRFGRLSHDNGSTGLGLYICKELVTLMNGSISFESDPGRLTAFWFSLPLAT